MRLQSHAYLSFAVKVVKYREHLFLTVEVLLEPGHLEYRLELLKVVVAEVVKQVVVTVRHAWSQKPIELVVCDWQSTLIHTITYQRLPNVVLKEVHILNQTAFIRSLITVLVLKHCNEVGRFEHDWQLWIRLIPFTLVLSNVNVSIHHVVFFEQPLIDMNQIVEVPDLTGFLAFNGTLIKLQQNTLNSKSKRDNFLFASHRVNGLLKVYLDVDVLANQFLALNFCI